MTSIRLKTNLADEAVRVLGAKSRTGNSRSLREILARKPVKDLMTKHAGRSFDRHNE